MIQGEERNGHRLTGCGGSKPALLERGGERSDENARVGLTCDPQSRALVLRKQPGPKCVEKVGDGIDR